MPFKCIDHVSPFINRENVVKIIDQVLIFKLLDVNHSPCSHNT